jgi:hypothetical protein
MRTIPVVSSALLVVGWRPPRMPRLLRLPRRRRRRRPRRRPSTSQYGLNLARIQRGLRKSAERQDYDGLNLRYYVNVYAPAPTIKLFTPLDNLLYGRLPTAPPRIAT